MLCPRCDDQGLIYKAMILNLNIKLYICDECDACWEINQSISHVNFKDLETFLETHNLSYEDTNLKDLGSIKLENVKRKRTFFNLFQNEIIALLDEAWLKKTVLLTSDPGTYIINMKRVIGTNGESNIKIIVKPGTSKIRTAYPI